MDRAIDHQSFDLMEHRGVGGVAIASIDPPRGNDPDRRRGRLHSAYLDRGGVGAEHHILAVPGDVERIVHRPRGVGLGNVERGEIVPVVFDFRAFGDREPEVGENFGEFVHHLADRMDRTLRGVARRKRQIDQFGRQTPVELGIVELVLLGRDCLRHRFAQGMNLGPALLPFVRRQRSHRLEQGGDLPRLAQRGDAQRLDRGRIASLGDAPCPVVAKHVGVSVHG